jgi:hypothetical protein
MTGDEEITPEQMAEHLTALWSGKTAYNQAMTEDNDYSVPGEQDAAGD